MPASLFGSVLDALTSPVTIFDQSGVIIYANKAWVRFIDLNAISSSNYGVNKNFLLFCQEGDLYQNQHLSALLKGLDAVITGLKSEFLLQLSTKLNTDSWFQVRITPVKFDNQLYAMVVHEDITGSLTSEYQLKNLLDPPPIGVAIVSMSGEFIETNHALEQLLGYSKAELLNLKCQQIQHPEDWDIYDAFLQKLKQHQYETYQVEQRFLRKDKSVVWVNLICLILHDEFGEPNYIIEQIQEVNSRKEIESALQQSEHRLQVVLDNMPALIGYWNKNLINEFGNKAYFDWFGIQPEQLKGKTLRQVIGEELYKLNLPYIRNVLDGKPQLFERIINTSSGEKVYSLASYIPDISEQGVQGFFVLVTDISKIKKVELELRKSEQFSRKLLSVSLDGFCFAQLDGQFLDANADFCLMLGYSKSELMTMTFSDIVALESPEQFSKRLYQLVSQGFGRFETLFLCKDGHTIDVEVSIAYLYDKKQIFSFVRDITERKQKETIRIRQLEQQRDMLVQEVHHRIKNHLQGLLGLLNLYAHKNPNEKTFLQEIVATINSIAVVYGIQGQRHTDTPCLCEIITEICKSVEAFSSIRLDYHFDGDRHVLLTTDIAVPIALVINELIINAVKHSNTLIPDNIAIGLTVSDNSVTLSIQNSCHNQDLFPDFERGVGLGLGLSLIRAMLPQQGVRLSLTNRDSLVCAELYLEQPIIIFEENDEDLTVGSVS